MLASMRAMVIMLATSMLEEQAALKVRMKSIHSLVEFRLELTDNTETLWLG